MEQLGHMNPATTTGSISLSDMGYIQPQDIKHGMFSYNGLNSLNVNNVNSNHNPSTFNNASLSLLNPGNNPNNMISLDLSMCGRRNNMNKANKAKIISISMYSLTIINNNYIISAMDDQINNNRYNHSSISNNTLDTISINSNSNNNISYMNHRQHFLK
jgi:hypothetical protein